mmetsp:Transcript_13940/g.42519  ORF Transcript_13940/g.42519 Transcript_13940/m.42519 type:complete len:209 (-) Transcript_13940:161-787(-)
MTTNNDYALDGSDRRYGLHEPAHGLGLHTAFAARRLGTNHHRRRVGERSCEGSGHEGLEEASLSARWERLRHGVHIGAQCGHRPLAATSALAYRAHPTRNRGHQLLTQRALCANDGDPRIRRKCGAERVSRLQPGKSRSCRIGGPSRFSRGVDRTQLLHSGVDLCHGLRFDALKLRVQPRLELILHCLELIGQVALHQVQGLPSVIDH